MSNNVFHLIQEFHNAKDSCSCAFDSLSENHWYNFYNDAYSNLISSHSALWGTLITAAVGIFAFKYYHDTVKIEKIKKSFEQQMKTTCDNFTRDIKDITKDEWNATSVEQVSHILNMSLPLINENNTKSLSSISKLLLHSLQSEKSSILLADTINAFFEKIKDFPKNILKDIESLNSLITEIENNLAKKKDNIWAPYINDEYIKKTHNTLSSTSPST